MTEQPDEQEIVPCVGCGVPILTFWAPNDGGMLRGEYDLIADTVWHKSCWDKQTAKFPINGQLGK